MGWTRYGEYFWQVIDKRDFNLNDNFELLIDFN